MNNTISFGLQGRVAIVTGGAQGIGEACVRRLHREGAHPVVVDIDDTRGQALAAELGLAYLRCDVGDKAQVDATVAAVVQTHGHIDILVNNAGITGGNAPTWELSPAAWRQVVEVNLIAPFLTCRAVVPGMIANGWGRIVNIASVAGKEGNPNASHYSASKAGLIGLTKSLGKELATKGVLVNAVAPAAARTAIFDQMAPEHIQFMLGKIPMGRFVDVDEIAAMVAWLCSPECSFATGAVFDLSGGRATY